MTGRDFSGNQVGRYRFSSLVGAGAVGSVYQAVDAALKDSPILAIKCIPKSPDMLCQHRQIAEMENHNTVAGSPHVLTLYDVFEEDGYFFLVLPLCETDMFRAIWKERLFWRNDALIKKVFIDVLDGIHACHKKGVFHRDLKPENIMCNADGTDIQIADFGLSTGRRFCRDGGCGTVSYMSPECLDEGGKVFYYADPVDIWSLGVILFNMVTNRYPWDEARPTDSAYMAFRSKNNYLLRDSPISTSLSELLHHIWHPTPMKRMSIPAIRQAIVDLDTFYRPSSSSVHTPSPLSKQLTLPMVDSQQTCVASAFVEEKKNSPRALMGLLELAPVVCCLD